MPPRLAPRASLPVLACGLVALLALTPGCRTTARLAGRATKATLSTATHVAVATTTTVASTGVRQGGKLAYAAADTSVDLAIDGVKAAARFSKQGAVVFFDPRRGAVAELPWRRELTVRTASRLAGFDETRQVVRLIRSGKAFAIAGRAARLSLSPGDVIELATDQLRQL